MITLLDTLGAIGALAGVASLVQVIRTGLTTRRRVWVDNKIDQHDRLIHDSRADSHSVLLALMLLLNSECRRNPQDADLDKARQILTNRLAERGK